MEQDINRRIEETLSTEKYIKPVLPKPFLYTRVAAKMQANPSRPLAMLIPVSVRVACAVVLMLNAAYFFSSITKSENASEQLASFYQLNSYQVYSSR